MVVYLADFEYDVLKHGAVQSKCNEASNCKSQNQDTENNVFQIKWEQDYLLAENNEHLQCLMRMQIIGVPKECNISWHYKTYHHRKKEKCAGEPNYYRIKKKKKQNPSPNQDYKQISMLI